MGGTVVFMSMKLTLQINKSKLLLVEGQDEVNFFKALLEKIGKCSEIQIIEVGGKNKFKTEFPAVINTSGFSENVESMAIIRDADDDYNAAFRSIHNLIEKYNFKAPSKSCLFEDGDVRVGIYIMPVDSKTGMLEDLCLKTKEGDPVMDCVEYFFGELRKKPVDQPSNMAKAKSQVFLAGMPKIVNSVGLGARRGYWNLDHPILKDLREFLYKL